MARHVKKPSIVEAVLHPQRLDILRILAINGPQTVRELAGALPAIAPATLYRHVKTLLSAGAIVVKETRTPERGAPETIYAVVEEAVGTLQLRGGQRSAASMRRYFVAVAAAVLAAFERRLQKGPIPSGEFAVRNSVVYLDKDELREVHAMFARLKELEGKRGGHRKPFSLSFALWAERAGIVR